MASPAKKAPQKAPQKPVQKAPPPKQSAPPAAHKAPPAKAPEKKPEPAKTAPKAEPKEEKATAAEVLETTALDRGWAHSAAPEGFDVVYTKSNPVLGGYEHLRVALTKAGTVQDLQHENLNRPVPVPDKDKFDHAIGVLTGEGVSQT
jgi:outer membrane biosynthesis protein TonB